MKKVIAAFALLAIVGSSLAFNAFQGQDLFIEGSTPGTCDVLAPGRYVTNNSLPDEDAIQAKFISAGSCQTLKVERNDD